MKRLFSLKIVLFAGASLPAPVDVENKSNASYSAVRVLSPFERTLRHVIQKVKR
jgi:phosphoribosylcarboxyaminoimidazole (NCAIR) mutase